MRERRVLAGEVDAALGRDDVLVQQRLLAGVEQRERAAGVSIVVPHLRRADLELVERLRMDARDVLERLRERAPSAPSEPQRCASSDQV